jgi:23S rRNA (adenine2503-C2)-methyltransferase
MHINLLQKTLSDLNQPKFRFNQILKNYFKGKYGSFESMTDLPKQLREYLDKNISLYSVKQDKIVSDEHTKKALLELKDGQKIETVLMDYDDWLTVCVSSQIGCPMNCSFCATGKMGFKRNLTAEEIVDQVLFWNVLLYPKYTGRVVVMGMGEPFLNWDNLVEALQILNSPDGLNLGARKISVSTSGIADKIIDFAALDTQINLAVSLHSVDQKTRESIMPVAKMFSLEELKKACDTYTQKTNRQIFFEYAPMKGINDTPKDIELLSEFIGSNKLFYLNLIPLNPIKGGMDPSPQQKFKEFEIGLNRRGIPFSIRRSFGQELNAACGQLVTQNNI